MNNPPCDYIEYLVRVIERGATKDHINAIETALAIIKIDLGMSASRFCLENGLHEQTLKDLRTGRSRKLGWNSTEIMNKLGIKWDKIGGCPHLFERKGQDWICKYCGEKKEGS